MPMTRPCQALISIFVHPKALCPQAWPSWVHRVISLQVLSRCSSSTMRSGMSITLGEVGLRLIYQQLQLWFLFADELVWMPLPQLGGNTPAMPGDRLPLREGQKPLFQGVWGWGWGQSSHSAGVYLVGQHCQTKWTGYGWDKSHRDQGSVGGPI